MDQQEKGGRERERVSGKMGWTLVQHFDDDRLRGTIPVSLSLSFLCVCVLLWSAVSANRMLLSFWLLSRNSKIKYSKSSER